MILENQVIRTGKNNKSTIYKMQINATIHRDKCSFFLSEETHGTIYRNTFVPVREIEEIHLPYLVLSGRAVRILEPFFA